MSFDSRASLEHWWPACGLVRTGLPDGSRGRLASKASLSPSGAWTTKQPRGKENQRISALARHKFNSLANGRFAPTAAGRPNINVACWAQLGRVAVVAL